MKSKNKKHLLDINFLRKKKSLKIFKEFIEEETKFRYVEKLFFLEIEASKNTDANILSFIETLDSLPDIRLSFLLVKKINKLKNEIDKEARCRGAQKTKNYKRCIFNFEGRKDV